MFGLISVEDKVRVKPADLGKPLYEAVQTVLDDTFLDKVITDVGLVVSLYDIQVCLAPCKLQLNHALDQPSAADETCITQRRV